MHLPEPGEAPHLPSRAHPRCERAAAASARLERLVSGDAPWAAWTPSSRAARRSLATLRAFTTLSVIITTQLACAPVNDRAHERSEGHRSASLAPSPRGAANESDAATPLAASPVAPPRVAGPVVLTPIEVTPPTHPLTELDDFALAGLIRTRTAELGSVSLGRPNRGGLFNGVQMSDGPLWHLEEPSNAWGTRETVDSIRHAIERVESDHPGSPPLHIGHVSRKRGGWLRPHRSHQSGRDVDLGYYYQDGPRWYAPATAQNLDRPRTWSLLMGLLTQGNVEYVFITRDVQTLLVEHAREQGFEESWLAELFDSVPASSGTGRKLGASQPLVRHRRGHHTHLHVRFHSDTACETGRRSFTLLRKNGKL